MHRDFGDGETETLGTGQHLDVEGEAVDRDEMEEQSGRFGAEALEPTLGVVEVEIGTRGDQPVEQSAHQQPEHVPALHHRVGQGPGPDSGVGGDQAIEEQGDGSRVDGHVCVHVRRVAAAGRSDTGSDGRALALVGGQADDAVMREIGQQGSGPARGVIIAAVIDHDDLGALDIDRTGSDSRPEPFESFRQSVGLVERGDDDAQPECGRRSPGWGKGTSWVDRRGPQLRAGPHRSQSRVLQGRAAPTKPPYQSGS